MATIDAAHRPWPPPAGPWVMAQTWNDLLFAHWPVAPDVVRRLIPAGLALDEFEGRAWVGVVPFWMSGIHLRGLPPLPFVARFPELNVRTYVTAGGRPGVWFFSLDAASPVAVRAARTWFRLPYFNARMAVRREGDTVRYRSRRAHRGAPPAELAGSYGPVGDAARAEPGTLAHWLTERYCLYAAGARGRLYRGEILHAPWPLRPAEATLTTNTMARAAGIALPDVPPLLHFAGRLEVVVWPLARVLPGEEGDR